MSKQSNILDPIHATLAPSVWDAPASTRPKLRLEHKMWVQKTIFDRFNEAGYDVQNWASLYVTGSITTYQYSDESDFDVSLFVNSEIFPEWSRAEMIGIAVETLDGSILPKTTYPLQVFIVPEGIAPSDIYKKGLRSGYDIERDQWVNPPDPDMAEDPSVAYNSAYVYALEQADKMERLLRYEPHKAQTLWHQIHKRRRADQKAGKGDYAPSNIVYKMLANRGLLDEISDVTGEYIAKVAMPMSENAWGNLTDEDPYVYHTTDLGSLKGIKAHGLLPWDDEGNPRASLYNQEELGGLVLPRPGHIYFALAPRPFEPDEDKILRVPKSALDPNLVNPDEDGLYDEDYSGRRLELQVGEQAEAWGYGDDEAETERSVKRLQTFAYRGTVPPEQIEIMIRSSGDEWAPNPHESEWVPLQQYSVTGEYIAKVAKDDRVYHMVPISAYDKVMREGLRPSVSEALRSVWPDAKPYIHAGPDIETLLGQNGRWVEENHGPFHVISAPRRYFEYADENMQEDDTGVEPYTYYSDQHIPPNELRHEEDWDAIDRLYEW